MKKDLKTTTQVISDQETEPTMKSLTMKVEEQDLTDLKQYARKTGRTTQGQIRYIIKQFLANPFEQPISTL